MIAYEAEKENAVSPGGSYPEDSGSGEVDANRMQSARKQGLRMWVAPRGDGEKKRTKGRYCGSGREAEAGSDTSMSLQSRCRLYQLCALLARPPFHPLHSTLDSSCVARGNPSGRTGIVSPDAGDPYAVRKLKV